MIIDFKLKDPLSVVRSDYLYGYDSAEQFEAEAKRTVAIRPIKNKNGLTMQDHDLSPLNWLSESSLRGAMEETRHYFTELLRPYHGAAGYDHTLCVFTADFGLMDAEKTQYYCAGIFNELQCLCGKLKHGTIEVTIEVREAAPVQGALIP